MSFCSLIKGISRKICILCVRVKINKRSFEPFRVWILSPWRISSPTCVATLFLKMPYILSSDYLSKKHFCKTCRRVHNLPTWWRVSKSSEVGGLRVNKKVAVSDDQKWAVFVLPKCRCKWRTEIGGLRVIEIVALMPHGSNGNNDEGRLMAKTVRIQMSGT